MPVSRLGQLITFAIEMDDDVRFQVWRKEPVKAGESVARIASRLGHTEKTALILRKNKIRSATTIIGAVKKTSKHKGHKAYREFLWVPGNMKDKFEFHVLAGDTPPIVTGGYAKLAIVNRPDRRGLTTFEGYDPLTVTVPIRFEYHPKVYRQFEGKVRFENVIRQDAHIDDLDVERDIALLERMAGRGQYKGAADGPPPVIHVGTTDSDGNVAPLLQFNLQPSPKNLGGPLWQIAGIDWDDGAIRDEDGKRIRQLATVTLQQYTKVSLMDRSASARSAASG